MIRSSPVWKLESQSCGPVQRAFQPVAAHPQVRFQGEADMSRPGRLGGSVENDPSGLMLEVAVAGGSMSYILIVMSRCSRALRLAAEVAQPAAISPRYLIIRLTPIYHAATLAPQAINIP